MTDPNDIEQAVADLQARVDALEVEHQGLDPMDPSHPIAIEWAKIRDHIDTLDRRTRVLWEAITWLQGVVRPIVATYVRWSANQHHIIPEAMTKQPPTLLPLSKDER